MKFTFTISLVFLALPLMLSGQGYKWEGGAFIGIANYQGDLVEPTLFNISESQMSMGLFLRRQLTPSFAARINAFHGSITGDDRNFFLTSYRPERAFFFKTTMDELSLLLEWEPLGKKKIAENGQFRKIVSPYLFAGLGAFMFDANPNFDLNQLELIEARIREDRTAEYSTTRLSIPFGAGIKLNATDRLSLGLEMGWHTAMTDYLDGISIAGDPTNNDWVFHGGATVAFRWGPTDMDKDGIVDQLDECPNIPGSDYLSGCPDMDADLVADHLDKCPTEAGSAQLDGCPDSDKDGIADAEDNCPNVPGLPETMGCPIVDADGDGIADTKDACPNEPGIASRNGCPIKDTDGDGIVDDSDNCPYIAGSLAAGGCPDSDKDGIADANDNCPDKPGMAEYGGCPNFLSLDNNVVDLILQNAFFESNSFTLSPAHYSMLDQLAKLMNEQPAIKLRIKGHTDNTGNESLNQMLSQNRAKACFDYLVDKGVSEEKISYLGLGEIQPDESNATEAGKQLNRRVEFNLYKVQVKQTNDE
jgi:outer membrane protein OmpA-like peptidoglycan-associated protein